MKPMTGKTGAVLDKAIEIDPSAIAIYDLNLRYIAVSNRYLHDYNANEKNVIGKHHYEVFPEMPQRWKDLHQRCLSGAIERNDDDYFERSDGSITHNRWECRPWYRADGTIGGIITYIEVTTERKIAEMALKESEAKYRDLVEQAWDAIFVVDPGGKILLVNEQACLMLGYTQAELAQLNIADTYAAEERAALEERIAKAQRGEHLRYERSIVRKDGTTFPVEVAIGMLPNGLIQGIVRDITERKQAEESLRMMSLWLGRTQDEERRRIARELHDSTGQKLAALSMIVGLLRDATGVPDGKTDKLFADCLAMIEQCAQEIRTLSYLLHPPLLDELGLAVAIGNYVEGFSKRSGVQVALDAPPALERLPAEVELALFRVVQESLGNIHRHAGASTARIHLACDAEQVTLEVSDQGCGMSAETIRAIEAGRGSTGVGIAGMRERLRLLGGRLEIESGGQGTTVRAIVPRMVNG